MLARAISKKKKKRPLLLADGEENAGGDGEYLHTNVNGASGMPRSVAPMTQQYSSQHHYHHHQDGSPTISQPSSSAARSRSSRISRSFGHGGDKAPRSKKSVGGGFVKKVFGGKKGRGDYGHYPVEDTGGVLYSDEDECDEERFEEEEESEEEPQVLQPRRRFVRSGLTTYEQWISKNSVGRRFNRRSYMPQPASNKQQRPYYSGVASPVKDADAGGKENSPTAGNEQSPRGGMSSLSSALQEVINSEPTVLKSVVDPQAASERVQRSFVVEQTADGNLFVMSKRVPVGPNRQTMDDSFIGVGRNFQGPGANVHNPLANPGRRSELNLPHRQTWGQGAAMVPSSAASGATGVPLSAAALLSMSKAGVRRRLSGADRGSAMHLVGDNISHAPTAMASVVTRIRRSSSSTKMRDLAHQSLLNQMASKYMDHARQRSSSKTSDSLPPPIAQRRKDSTAMLLQGGSFEEVDALPMTMDDLVERKQDDLTEQKPSVDKGPMTMDEFMFDQKPAPSPPPLLRKVSSGSKSGRRRTSKAAQKEEEEVDNMLTRSFLNLKDVDALKRSRSQELDDEEKVVAPAVEETETEDEYPEFAEERATDDYGSSYEDESPVRNSNITEFLGGYKGRGSMNRNSLAGRNSLGRNSVGKNDFVSRAARSLRNSRKVAQETIKASSELSRKLQEARARVPMDLRGDPPHPTRKKRGFMGRDGKRVRYDMTPYIREFEVIEPEPSDDEVQQWAQRDSEQDDDDDDDDDDDEHSADDDNVELGVPVPGAVLAAAMTDANAYYQAMPASALHLNAPPMRYSSGRVSVQENKRVSVVSQRSNANQFEVYM